MLNFLAHIKSFKWVILLVVVFVLIFFAWFAYSRTPQAEQEFSGTFVQATSINPIPSSSGQIS